MDCSTVIVSYNTFGLTAEAVRSALSGAPGLDHEVVVVDNASPDQSASRLRDAFEGDGRVRVLGNPGNVGFSAANNQGAAVTTGRVLLFLNPDTVVHGNAIARIVAYLDAHPEAGAVGPRVLNTDGTDQASTAQFASLATILRHCFPILPSTSASLTDPTAVDIVKGCALAVRRDAFERVGGWDERYFMYSEENELCLSLHKAGYTNVFLPEATITHHGGAASADRYSEQQVAASKSHVAFLRRHGSRGLVAVNRLASVAGYGLRAAAFSVLARVWPQRSHVYRRRGEAASAIWRWYAFDHS